MLNIPPFYHSSRYSTFSTKNFQYFSYFSIKIYVVVLITIEMLLMSTTTYVLRRNKRNIPAETWPCLAMTDYLLLTGYRTVSCGENCQSAPTSPTSGAIYKSVCSN